jgi:L-fuconolactonase
LIGAACAHSRSAMRIDSHQHYWKVSRGDYHWMSPAIRILHRDDLPPDLLPSLVLHNIQKTIVVQAAQTVAETDLLLDLAAANHSIAGVIGWLDMEDPSFMRKSEQYQENPRFIGLCPMRQDLSDDRWITRPQVLVSLKLLAESNFPFEFLTFPRHLPFVLETLEAVPGLRVVIDHISKPENRAKKFEPWCRWISRLAEHRNLYCRLSGMITETDHRHWSVDDLRPYVEHIVVCFGWDRLMFGSDWPVCLLAGSYDQVVGVLQQFLSPNLDPIAEPKLFGDNAVQFYRLDVEAEG